MINLWNKTLRNVRILSGSAVMDVTGNVTGNLTGDVTGDVTGNVTGNLTGDVTGNVTGYIVLPTTDPGVAGALYLSGGVVTVSAGP